MKFRILCLVSIVMLASCSTPKKYAYNFDHYNYKSVKKGAIVPNPKTDITEIELESKKADLITNPDDILARQGNAIAEVESNPIVEKVTKFSDKYAQGNDNLSKADQKTLKKEMRRDLKSLKKDLRNYIKTKKSAESVQATKAMDHDLKLALIFLIVALITGIFSWILGTVFSIVALVFLIMWLAKQ